MFKQGIQNGLVIKSKPEFNQSTSMQFNVKGILRTFKYMYDGNSSEYNDILWRKTIIKKT